MVEEDTKKEVLDADTYYEKGNYYYEQGDYDRAIENYNMAIILNPRFLECYFNRALCYYNKKNYDKAIEDYTKAIEIDPDNPMIYNNRGDAYYRKQDFEKAIADYNKAISLNPEYLKAYYNRGLAYASMQDYESGVENFTKVIELDPNFVEAYNARGLAYEFLEKYDEAIADYQKALEINPNFTEAQEHLAAAQKKKSEKEASSGEGVSAVKFMAKPKVTFKDVVGMDHVKELIREYIVYPLKDPELARKYGKFGGGGVLFYGPPGCGKCVSPDTPIQLSNGQILSIEEIYNIARGNGKEIKVGEEEIVENPSVKVLSLNPTTLKIEEKNVLFAYKQRYKGKMYEIITRSGRKISVTPEHPFFSVDNGVVKIKAKDLFIGSYIAIPRELTVQPVPLIANESQDMFLPISIFRIQNSGLDSVSNQTNVRLGYKTYRRPAKEFNQINYVDQDVAELFGYLLSEGSSNGGTIFFFNSDKNLVDRVEYLSFKVFGIKPRIKPDRSQNVLRLEISSTGLIKYLEQTHGFKLIGSRNTKVPISIITAKNKIVAEFLSAVFESEANIRKDVPEIEFTTASKVFANQISYLLLRFGIIGRIKENSVRGYDHTYYRIYVTGHNQLKLFEETIGFKSERKRKLLRKWTSNQVKENTNVDVIPNVSNLLMKAREGLGMNKEQFYNTSSKHGKAYESSKHLSRNLLARLISDKRETNEIKELRLLSDSSVLWDEVVKIREFDYDGFVYDLTVEDNHNFIAGFGGIVVHNTFIMKAAAGEVGANFLNVKLSDVLDMYVGNTEKNIRNIFEAARKAAPCIIFIDEIDGLGGRREQMKESGQYMRMAVNQLLYEMDGVEARNENVLVVAATNAPWDVDPALRRAGRFSKLIYVGEPDYASRKAMFQYYAKGRPVSKNIDWDRLARATEGYSSSDIKAISDDAAAIPWIEALKTGKQREITMKDYIEVLDPFAADPIKYLTAAKKPKGKKSSLPPWYESAKKEIGKQEEVETVDGKEIKRIKEPKMPPGEREYFKELIDLIESRNKPHNKFLLWLWRKSALYQDYLVPFVIAGIIYLLYIAFQSSLGF